MWEDIFSYSFHFLHSKILSFFFLVFFLQTITTLFKLVSLYVVFFSFYFDLFLDILLWETIFYKSILLSKTIFIRTHPYMVHIWFYIHTGGGWKWVNLLFAHIISIFYTYLVDFFLSILSSSIIQIYLHTRTHTHTHKPTLFLKVKSVGLFSTEYNEWTKHRER